METFAIFHKPKCPDLDDFEAINSHLDGACLKHYPTPELAYSAVRQVLDSFDIELPEISFADLEEGEDVVQIEDEDAFLYFGYCLDDLNLYEIHAEIMPEDDLDEFMEDPNIDAMF